MDETFADIDHHGMLKSALRSFDSLLQLSRKTFIKQMQRVYACVAFTMLLMSDRVTSFLIKGGSAGRLAYKICFVCRI